MVLVAAGKTLDTKNTHLQLLVKGRSAWTIDLAELLHQHSIEDFTYYTSYIGINWAHRSRLFYSSSLQEHQRINQLFAHAAFKGIRIVSSQLTTADLLRFLLSGNYAILLLVDASMLVSKKSIFLSSCFCLHSSSIQSSFQGHYILAIGYDEEQQSVVVRDPSSSHPNSFLSLDSLETARHSPGTDHDAIVIRIK